MSEKYIKVNNLSVAQPLYDFINNEAIPHTKINQKKCVKNVKSIAPISGQEFLWGSAP